jgi:SAM-dependent methyltransferase
VTIDARAAIGFGRAAAEYERGRPGYPDAAVAFLVDRLRLGSDTIVVDLAAGTGKLARQLQASGARVVAVEPVDAMRALIPPGIEPVAGTAEELPLEDGSADAVTVAQAFHWFRTQDALREIHRVLRARGVLAAVRNRRDPEDPVQAEFLRILGRRRSHPSLEAGRDVEGVLAASGLFGHPESRSFPHVHELGGETLVAQAASESSIAVLDGDARVAALAEFRRLAETLPPRYGLRYRTEIVVADRA